MTISSVISLHISYCVNCYHFDMSVVILGMIFMPCLLWYHLWSMFSFVVDICDVVFILLLLAGFPDVAFLPSLSTFTPHFINIVVREMASGPSHDFKMWFGIGNGMLPVRYFCSNRSNFMAVIRLSQVWCKSGHSQFFGMLLDVRQWCLSIFYYIISWFVSKCFLHIMCTYFLVFVVAILLLYVQIFVLFFDACYYYLNLFIPNLGIVLVVPCFARFFSPWRYRFSSWDITFVTNMHDCLLEYFGFVVYLWRFCMCPTVVYAIFCQWIFFFVWSTDLDK